MLDCKYLSPGAARSLLAPGANGGARYAGRFASESPQGRHIILVIALCLLSLAGRKV